MKLSSIIADYLYIFCYQKKHCIYKIVCHCFLYLQCNNTSNFLRSCDFSPKNTTLHNVKWSNNRITININKYASMQNTKNIPLSKIINRLEIWSIIFNEKHHVSIFCQFDLTKISHGLSVATVHKPNHWPLQSKVHSSPSPVWFGHRKPHSSIFYLPQGQLQKQFHSEWTYSLQRRCKSGWMMDIHFI